MADFKILEQILDSNDFTVGGGAASAMAGAMAAGLISMVAKLSLNKDYGLTDEQYKSVAEEGDALAKELILGAEEDRQAFLKIKNAYAMPKESEEEKGIRKKAIQEGGIAAATVPKNNGLKCSKVYEMGLLLLNKSNSNATSDLEEGIMLAKAGIIGCALNIEANLPLIKDQVIKEGFENDIKYLKNIASKNVKGSE